MIKTVLVAKGEGVAETYRLLRQCSDVDLIGVACLDGKIEWLSEKERKKLFVTADLEKIIALPELETVIDSSGESPVSDFLRANLADNVQLEELKPRSLLNAVLRSKDQLLETRQIKGELLAILNSVRDAIEVVDEKGMIKYVNPAFTRVTGIVESKRLGLNIFDVSPHGALAQSLIQQKPVTAYRTYVGGSDADVISNASPIIIDGELKGAVVVFQPVGDILKLMDELKHSNAIIDNLYAQIDQISGSRFSFDLLVGQCKSFTASVEKARKTARSDSALLICGESGTGKSLFARAVHSNSGRKKRPLIVVDCAAVPDSLQEIEIFGCEKGAMPGILRTRLGKIELAQGSTLFIKEVNSLNPFLQKKLTKVINERSFCRIGGNQPIAVDVRIVASTSEDLVNASLRGKFAEGLYRKLGTVKIDLPPLRKRRDDIPLLAKVIIENLNRKLGKNILEISPRALQELTEYDWPGNISELKSVIERAMVVSEGSLIEYHHLSLYCGKPGIKEGPALDEIMPLDKIEEVMLKLALTRYGETLEGKKKAAQALNISLATLYNKLKKYSV